MSDRNVVVRDRQPGESPAVAKYLEALVDPYIKDPVSVPSPFPYRRTNVKEIKEFDLKQSYIAGTPGPDATPGSCFIEIYPQINNTVVITANAAEPASVGVLAGTFSGIGESGVAQDPTSGQMTRRCIQMMHPFEGKPAFQITTGTSTNCNLVMQTIASEPSNIATAYHVWVYTAGVWSLLTTTSAQALNVSSTTALTLISSMEAIAFQSLTDAGPNLKVSYKCNFTIQNIVAPGIGCPNVVSNMSSVSMNLENKIDDLEAYGVTALGVLITYQGSDLKNGGKIYSAWVPVDWQPDNDNLLESMSSLAYDRFDGPLKEGTHCHWFPAHLDELLMTRPGSPSPMSKKLVIYVLADDNTQTTRMRLTMHQQYYSQSPAYGNMAYGPSGWSLSPGLCWLANNVPVCTSNDNHLVKKAFSAISSGAKSGLKYAIDHPERIAELASLLL